MEKIIKKEKIKKSRGYFPDTEQGQVEYEKQWKNDKQFSPTKVRKDYSNWTPASEHPKSFINEEKNEIYQISTR